MVSTMCPAIRSGGTERALVEGAFGSAIIAWLPAEEIEALNQGHLPNHGFPDAAARDAVLAAIRATGACLREDAAPRQRICRICPPIHHTGQAVASIGLSLFGPLPELSDREPQQQTVCAQAAACTTLLNERLNDCPPWTQDEDRERHS